MRTKLIAYGRYADIYTYEKYGNVSVARRRIGEGGSDGTDVRSDVLEGRRASQDEEIETRFRTERSAKRSQVAFRRLVECNLAGCSPPAFVTITFREGTYDYDVGRCRASSAIARCRAAAWMGGAEQRWISVLERHEDGKIHTHALAWGIPNDVINAEREERNIALTMDVGWVDVVSTDGAPALAGYMSKYLYKAKHDPTLLSKKAYVATRNVRRPYVDTDAVLAMYRSGEHEVDLSTVEKEYEQEYDTVYLGRAHFTRYKLLNAYVG